MQKMISVVVPVLLATCMTLQGCSSSGDRTMSLSAGATRLSVSIQLDEAVGTGMAAVTIANRGDSTVAIGYSVFNYYAVDKDRSRKQMVLVAVASDAREPTDYEVLKAAQELHADKILLNKSVVESGAVTLAAGETSASIAVSLESFTWVAPPRTLAEVLEEGVTGNAVLLD